MLATIAQGLFVFQSAGSTIGGFALLMLVVVALLRPLTWRNHASRLALGAAAMIMCRSRASCGVGAG